eukprot:1257172-Lingulodinium_polyedra.AAC.1
MCCHELIDVGHGGDDDDDPGHHHHHHDLYPHHPCEAEKLGPPASSVRKPWRKAHKDDIENIFP